MNEDLSFAEALKLLLSGVRMSARFLPDTIYIELQMPDEHSMNTEPYLKMVTVMQEDGKPDWKKCVPWEPGHRSLFSNEWYTSKWQGIDRE